MDCGPAALKSFLGGHGILVHYDRLREACATSVDGTSIESLEMLSGRLGLPAEQVLVPKDYLFLDATRAFPSIGVVRLPNGNVHFTVLWRSVAGFVQLMDPARGRIFSTRRQLSRQMYEHVMPISAEYWREWASSGEARAQIEQRCTRLRIPASVIVRLEDEAAADPSWYSLASLDAAIRLTRAAVDAGVVAQGPPAATLLQRSFDNRRGKGRVLERFRSVKPMNSDDPSHESVEQLITKGVLLVRPADGAVESSADEAELSPAAEASIDQIPIRDESSAVESSRRWPVLSQIRELCGQTPLLASVLGVAAVASAFTVIVEALLLRSLLELTGMLGMTESRLVAWSGLMVFVVLMLVLEAPLITGPLRVGRRLEIGIRAALHAKLPHLSDTYFRSRLTSDLAERAHRLHILRELPLQALGIVRPFLEVIFTTLGVLWLEPSAAPWVIPLVLVLLCIPWFGQKVLAERDLRVRTHVGGLSRFYLDGLLGLIPLRAHGAQESLRVEHESLLVEWARARLSLQQGILTIETTQYAVGCVLVVTVLLSHVTTSIDPTASLLLVYWSLNIPVLALQVAKRAERLPEQRNALIRVQEPLGYETDSETMASARRTGLDQPSTDTGVELKLDRVSVSLAGQPVLKDWNLDIPPGSHVAVIGGSGAGKSSFIALLLGFLKPDRGALQVDGKRLDHRREWLRSVTAWLDPAVQIWNRSLLDNLNYGNTPKSGDTIKTTIEDAALRDLVEVLPEGLQTEVGEGGRLLSGGEGQRLRFGRVLLRDDVRLLLFDEPFRGLERRRRSQLLRTARKRWRKQTFVCVTHDVGETIDFDRVLVLEGGEVVEDGAPRDLLNNINSRYSALIDAERRLEETWRRPDWRHLSIVDGQVVEGSALDDGNEAS